MATLWEKKRQREHEAEERVRRLAPELLDALKAAIRIVHSEYEGPDGKLSGCHGFVERVEALIKRAEGDAQ